MDVSLLRKFRSAIFFLSFVLVGFCDAETPSSTPDTGFLKMSDAITPFFDAFDSVVHYSSLPYTQYETSTGVGINEAKLAQATLRYQSYIRLLAKEGYTAVSLDDLNHLLNIKALFGSNTLLARRNAYFITYFQARVAEARQAGLKVYVTTDMQFYNDEMTRSLGEITLKNPKLKTFNERAFRQLFLDFPEISGVILRIGEGGGAYNSGNYKSAILYQTPATVHQLISTLLPVFEDADKTLVFRTWSIGVGQVGDLVRNRATYDQVFDGLNSPHLIVSVKHTPGDFFAFSHNNPTLGRGNLQQIVEIQIRREYEGGGDFVNFFPLEYLQIYEYIRSLPQVVGVWNWNQTGGWGRGHHIAFNYGFAFWDEVNFHAVGYILRGGIDLKTFLRDYLANDGYSQAQIEVLSRIFLASREVIEKGWYIDDFRKQSIVLGKVNIPPLLRIWWDRPTDSLGVWALMLSVISDTQNSIQQSKNALQILNQEIKDWKQVASPSQSKSQILVALEYQRDLFEILSIFRASMIGYFQNGHKEYLGTLREKISKFQARYGQNANYAFDFQEIRHETQTNNSGFLEILPFAFLHFLVVMLAILWYGGGALGSGHYQEKFKRFEHPWKLLRGRVNMWKYSPYFFLGKHHRKTTLALVLLYSATLMQVASESSWYQVYLSGVWFFLGHLLFFLLLIFLVLRYVFGEKSYSLSRMFPFENIFFVIMILEVPLFLSLVIPEPWIWIGIAKLIFSPLKYVLLGLSLLVFVIGFERIFHHVFLFEQKKIRKMLLLLCVWLCYLSQIVPLQASKQYWLETISPILPSYFMEAGTDVGEYYE